MYKSGMEQALMELEELRLVGRPCCDSQACLLTGFFCRTRVMSIMLLIARLIPFSMVPLPRSTTSLTRSCRLVCSGWMKLCTRWNRPCKPVTRMPLRHTSCLR